jgi:hypothetical protein
MSTHVRRQIREAVKAALLGTSVAGDRVATGDPYPPAILPAIIVVGAREAPNDDYSTMQGRRGRTLVLQVIGYAEQVDVENALDAIGLEVEQRLDGNPLGGLVKDLRFAGTSKTLDADSEARSGEVILSFEADYRIQRGTPETSIA